MIYIQAQPQNHFRYFNFNWKKEQATFGREATQPDCTKWTSSAAERTQKSTQQCAALRRV